MFDIENDDLTYPLTLALMDKLNTDVYITIFVECNNMLVKSHSFRKVGASSYYTTEINSFDVKLIDM